MEYKYTGIILNKRDVGETDRIYTLYTQEGGKIKSLAKGVRKPHAKLAASLENITLADVTLMRTKGLGKITGSIVEDNFTFLKSDCDALLKTFDALKTFDKLVDFEHPDENTFNLLKSFLETINASVISFDIEKYEILRLGFIMKLLNALGYTIEVSSCVICGAGLSKESIYFSARHGGVLCENCKQSSQGTISVRPDAVKMLRLFLGNEMRSLSKIKASQADHDSARLMLDEFLRWNL
ncbi:MAG TPA: DNA repair protein RecO [Patescibacteria group bacterium]